MLPEVIEAPALANHTRVTCSVIPFESRARRSADRAILWHDVVYAAAGLVIADASCALTCERVAATMGVDTATVRALVGSDLELEDLVIQHFAAIAYSV